MTFDPQGFVASPAGYLVVEGGQVWFSKDGMSWTPAALPFEPHPMSNGDRSTRASGLAAAGGPKGFIVVGDYEHEPCDQNFTAGGPPDCAETPISWVSPNGLDWTSSIGAPLPLQGLKNPDYRAFREVWSAGDGWDASVESEESVDERALELLHTSDGVHWTALAKPPVLAVAKSLALRSGVGLPSGQRLVWQQWDRITDHWGYTFAMTLDGKTWSTVNAFDGRVLDVGGALAPDATAGGPWLIGISPDDGRAAGSSRANGGPVILSSTDLLVWHAERVSISNVPGVGVPTSFARWAGGYLAIVVVNGDDGVLVHQTWSSPDGSTWHLAGSVAVNDSAQTLMASGPAGVLGARVVDGKLEVSVVNSLLVVSPGG